MPEALPEDVAEALLRSVDRRDRFGARILYFSVMASTNDAAAALADAGAAEGTVVLASAQTAGREGYSRDPR